MNIEPETKREIIIVRRGGHDDHEAHHGGVWKIAYADFMTAMASYFNPVKLMDRHSSPKGVENVDQRDGKVRFESDQQVESSTKVVNDTTVRPASDQEERQLFREPYAMLAELAHETGVLQNQSAKGDGGTAQSGSASGADGGEAYRDPFSPDYWSSKAVGDLTPPAPQTVPQTAPLPQAQPKKAETQEELIADLKKAATGEPAPNAGKAAKPEPMPDVTVVPVEGA